MAHIMASCDLQKGQTDLLVTQLRDLGYRNIQNMPKLVQPQPVKFVPPFKSRFSNTIFNTVTLKIMSRSNDLYKTKGLLRYDVLILKHK